MKNLDLPFDESLAERIANKFGTPIYIYDERGIRSAAKRLRESFSNIKSYKNYFAVKATPTPAILTILKEEGMGFDCSSAVELEIAKRLGAAGDDIFFTSNNTPEADFVKAIELGAIVNIDDLTQIPVFLEALSGKPYKKVGLRYNPGDLKDGNTIIGKPTESKFGMRLDQLVRAVQELSEAHIQQIGLHTMVASNEIYAEYFAETAEIVAGACNHIQEKTGKKIDFVNLGGGFGVNYRPEQEPLDLAFVARSWQVAQKTMGGIPLYSENGRYVTGPNGYLLTRIRYIMEKYKTYIGVDASMQNLMRPGMYGAYHHLTVLGEHGDSRSTFDVSGSLCENNDKFAIDRELPADVKPEDLVVTHDVGAHGHSMGFNYNGQLRSSEVLFKADGSVELIRRAETTEDYLRNVVWQ